MALSTSAESRVDFLSMIKCTGGSSCWLSFQSQWVEHVSRWIRKEETPLSSTLSHPPSDSTIDSVWHRFLFQVNELNSKSTSLTSLDNTYQQNSQLWVARFSIYPTIFLNPFKCIALSQTWRLGDVAHDRRALFYSFGAASYSVESTRSSQMGYGIDFIGRGKTASPSNIKFSTIDWNCQGMGDVTSGSWHQKKRQITHLSMFNTLQ